MTMRQAKYTYLLTLAYFVVSLIGILHHELWLDESHHWLLARDSSSFSELLTNTRYEGHPILWNILLFAISRLTLNPFAMQLLHILISTGVVYLVARRAPFPVVFKILFIFGYFMLFEYNIISRNYMIGVLFIFLACSLFRQRHKRFLSLSLLLALAANTHLMFAVIAFALFLTLVLENYLERKLFDRFYFLGYLIFFLGLAIAIIQIVPPSDTRFFDHVNETPLAEKFTKGFISLFKATFTIPDFSSIHFWNSNAIANFSKTLAAISGLIAYLLPILIFSRSRKTLFFVYAALIGTQIFFFCTQLGATRYDGMAFIIIIAGLWIEPFFGRDNFALKTAVVRSNLTLLRKPILYSILAIQFLSGITAYAMDFVHPFTGAKSAVEYISKTHPGERVISASCEGTSISPYLEKKVYSLCSGSLQSYCRWNNACANNIAPERMIPLISDYMQSNETGLFALYDSIPKQFNNGQWMNLDGKIKIRFLKKFDNHIVRQSNYYIYEAVNESIQ
jgi:hypothetical protein